MLSRSRGLSFNPDNMHAARQPHVFLPFFLFFFEMSVSSSIFLPFITGFALYGEYDARFPLPDDDGVFPRCDRGLGF